MKIAVVGSGVSGLAAAWLLNEHSVHEVHLFDTNDGHAGTITCLKSGSTDVNVHAGFVAFDPTASPNFLHFLEHHPDITVLPTRMPFRMSQGHRVFQWVGAANSLAGVFCQPSHLLDPRMWRLLYDILRFNACARRLVINKDSHSEGCSVAEYLSQEGYSGSFRDDYLIPMIAVIWGTPPDECLLQIPAQTLVRFMNNHHLLQIKEKPAWLIIKGGSYQYAKSVLEKLPESQLHLSTRVTSVGNTPDGRVQITTAAGRSLNFDRVIMTCRSDTTLTLLKEGYRATEEEEKILGRFTWSQNEVALHRDVNLMPKTHLASSSAAEQESVPKAAVTKASVYGTRVPHRTYDLNLLQALSVIKYGPLFMTLNPTVEPGAGTIVARFQHDHPVLNNKALVSMREMHKIQGRRGILYAGAWLGYGLHEDGFTSGLRAVMHHIEGVRVPFEIESVSTNRPVHAVFVAYLFDLFEWSGARSTVGAILSFILALLGRLIVAVTTRVDVYSTRKMQR